MPDVVVKLKIRGINEVLRSQPVVSALARRAHRIKTAAGDHFEMVVKPHPWTARVFVQSADRVGAEQEAQHKVLTRALDAGRD